MKKILILLSLALCVACRTNKAEDPKPDFSKQMRGGVTPSNPGTWEPAYYPTKDGKPAYAPSFVESLVGFYDVYLEHEVYTCEIMQQDAVNFLIKNFDNRLTLPVQNIQGTTTFRQPEWNPDYRIYTINPVYSYWQVDGSITIQAYIGRQYVTIRMYRRA